MTRSGIGKRRSLSKDLRLAVMDEGNWTCHYCQAPATEVDHIIPRSRGGRDIFRNLVPCCEPCNDLKADNMPEPHCQHCRRALRRHDRDQQRANRWDALTYIDWTQRGTR